MEIKSENIKIESVLNTIQKNNEILKDDKIKKCNNEQIKKHNDKEAQCSLITGKVNYII